MKLILVGFCLFFFNDRGADLFDFRSKAEKYLISSWKDTTALISQRSDRSVIVLCVRLQHFKCFETSVCTDSNLFVFLIIMFLVVLLMEEQLLRLNEQK